MDDLTVNKNIGVRKSARQGPVGGKLAVALIIILLLAAGILGYKYYKLSDGGRSADKWHAVFLTNGQVYFGQLASTKSDHLVLTSIYYLQVQQSIQPPEEVSADGQQRLSLTKLGRNELHCPVDEMVINRDQVLFWEELKAESRVVTAINEYLKTDDITKKCYEDIAR